MGHGTASGRSTQQVSRTDVTINAAERVNMMSRERGRQQPAEETNASKYLQRIQRLNTMTTLNNLLEEAANDDNITNREYQQIYDAAIGRVRQIGG